MVAISAPDGYAEAPVLAADARGDAVAAWVEYRSSGETAQFGVVSSSRSAGSGRWSPPADLSDVNAGPDEPKLALAPSGAAVIVWTESVRERHKVAPTFVLEASTRASASAPWAKPVSVSSAGAFVADFALGIDRDGLATVVWNRGFARNPKIVWVTVSAATGVWGRPQQLAGAGAGGARPQLTVNERGAVLVAWQREVSRTNHRNYQPTVHYAEITRFRPAGEAWQAPIAIGHMSEVLPSPGAMVWAPDTPTVALDDAGGRTVMWQSMSGRGQVLELAHRLAGAARCASAPVVLTKNSTAPVIGSDAAGQLTVVWTDRRGRIILTSSNDGAHWSSPVAVRGGAGAFLTWLSESSDGHEILTWLGPHNRVLVSQRPGPHSAWEIPVVAGHGGFPQAALDIAGDGTVVWPRLLPRPNFGAVIDAITLPPA